MVSKQLILPFEAPLKHVEIHGIPMGVLKDGTPYLTARGLSRLCGVSHTSLIQLAINWDTEKNKPRGKRISELLYEQGYEDTNLYVGILESGYIGPV